MSRSAQKQCTWSTWHERLHKALLNKANLIPQGSSVLIAVSGGQDSMALLKLIHDLRRLHNWDIKVWHGDHHWHNKSSEYAIGVKEWCETRKIDCYLDQAEKEQAKNEKEARDWRYKCLKDRVNTWENSKKESNFFYVLTAHTSTDRVETFLINLARGTNIAGLVSLNESRKLAKNAQLTRPFLIFSREETLQICQQLHVPIWIDPANEKLELTRNRVRKIILPELNNLYKGCELRISELISTLLNYKDSQQALTLLALEGVEECSTKKICRHKVSLLPISARATLLECWLRKEGVPSINASQLKEISYRIEVGKAPGNKSLPKKWQLQWCKNYIYLIKEN